MESEQQCSCATDKALEYYLKYGKERNIEKFLRLQPARIHSHTHCKYKMSRNEQAHCSTAITSQVLPLEISNASLQETETEQKSETVIKEEPAKAEATKNLSSASSTDTNASATLVRIFRESVEAEILRKSHKNSKLSTAVSDEDLRTPPKNKSRETPRSNRRLEWDSLADIGYRRCKSQTNISMLERMVLKQLLQDCSGNNLTERDYKLLEVLLHEQDGQDGSQITRTKSLDTPPLASSTHIELKQKIQATPVGQERSVQTTISRASKSTQEVQVNIETNKAEKSTEVEINNTDSELSAEQKQEQASAYVCDTLLESTSTEGFQVATNKSFHRSKSLDTTGVKSNDMKRFEKAIQSGISSLSNTSEDERKTALGELEKTLEEQLLKRKKSTDKNAATMQLELGVQLLCALIEALHLHKSEKKKLVTEIVQRICRTCGNTAAGELLTMLKPRMKEGESKSTSESTSVTSEEITKKEKSIGKENHLPTEVATSSTHRELISKATNTHITRAKKVENAPNGSKRTITTQTSFEPIYISKSAEISSSSTSRENMSIADWLQPTTLSELEYEQYKQEIEWNSKKRQSIMEQSVGDLTGKQQMLSNWVKMEIRRLERLRSLMQNNKDYASSSSHMQSSSISRASEQSNIVPNRKEPIYDQVADTLKTKPVPVRKHVINVEINQDKENRFSEPSVKYIQPLINEDTVLRERNKQHSTREFILKVQQRSKMATPSTSESLTSFETQSEKLPKQKISNEAQTEETHVCTCRHMQEAIPHNNYYYPYHNHHHHHQCVNWHCCRCHNAGAPQYYTTKATVATAATATTTTTNVATQKPSTSSLTSKCSQSASSSSRRNTQTYTLPINVVEKNSLTSEVPVPMGSSTTMSSSSASRTTHQYDDLNAVRDIAVQTSKLSLQSEQSEIVETGLRMQAKSIAYVLEFHAPKAATQSQAESSTDLSDNIESLQAHLEKKRPMFVAKSRERKAMLNRLQKLRQQREKELRELVENTSINSIEPKLKKIPPLPTGQVRLYSTKQMKDITRKRASKLPEVLAREQREKEERRRRSNRLLRDLFSRRLQKRVRIGQISLNHSKTVI